MAKPRRKGGPKQKLSPAAAKAKAIRDKKYAMTDRRRRFKAESQRKDCPKGHDYDHNTKRCVTSSHNRGGTQSRSKKDGTKAERRQNKK
jgi:hypothetical protein